MIAKLPHFIAARQLRAKPPSHNKHKLNWFVRMFLMEARQKQVDTAKIYPNPVSQSTADQKQQAAIATAMAELEIMKATNAKSAAGKNPEIRDIALLLIIILGITLFGQISTYLIAKSFSNIHTSFWSAFASNNGPLGITLLLVEVIAIFILLFTRNMAHAKTVIAVAGIGFGATLIKGIFSFQIGPAVMANFATLVVNFLILRKIFKAYMNL